MVISSKIERKESEAGPQEILWSWEWPSPPWCPPPWSRGWGNRRCRRAPQHPRLPRAPWPCGGIFSSIQGQLHRWRRRAAGRRSEGRGIPQRRKGTVGWTPSTTSSCSYLYLAASVVSSYTFCSLVRLVCGWRWGFLSRFVLDKGREFFFYQKLIYRRYKETISQKIYFL